MRSVSGDETEQRVLRQIDGPGYLAEVLYRFLPALMLAAILLRPVGVSDLGWQIRLGELMQQQGSPFVREPFAAIHIDEQLTPNAWLAQLVYFQGWGVGGWVGLRALDALLWVGGLLVVAIAARRRVDRPLAVAAALIVAFVVALPAASIRPQSFASLAFGLALVLMKSTKPAPITLVMGALLFVAWQNFHPSVSMAALIIGAVAGVRWCQHFLVQEDRPWTLSAMALVAGISVFCTPAGTGILEFARYNTEASLFYGATEWLPLWSPINRAFLLSVSLSAVLTGFVAFKYRERIRLEDTIPFVITLLATFAAVRFILFYAISVIPILSHLKLGVSAGREARKRLVKFSVMSWLICAGELFVLPVVVEKEIPVAALRELNSAVGDGTIFCDPAFGGVLINAGFPHRRVAFDGRFYLYSIKELRRFKETRYNPSLLPEIERMYSPVAFALVQSHSLALVRELRAHPQIWRETHSVGDAVFFARSSASRVRRPGD